MLSLTVDGVAICLAFFLFRPSVCILEEYTPLYLRQIGYSPSFIGLAPVLGLVTQTIGIPLLGHLADKFRARKLFLFLSVLISIPGALLFFAAQTPNPICDESTGNLSHTNKTMLTLLNRTSNFSSPSAASSDNDEERLKYFSIFMALRGIFELLKRLTVTLITVAAMTHLKQDKSKFGYYACWGEIGGGLALFMVGMSLNHILHYVCGKQESDYVAIFFFVAKLSTLVFRKLTLTYI